MMHIIRLLSYVSIKIESPTLMYSSYKNLLSNEKL